MNSNYKSGAVVAGCDQVLAKIAAANTRDRELEALDRMKKRRFQQPKPRIEGRYYYLRFWSNTPGTARKRERIKLAPADTPYREALKLAAEHLQNVNRRLVTNGAGINFQTYVEDIYIPTFLPLLAKGVQVNYVATIRKHLFPVFANDSLHDMSELALQRFFSAMPGRGIGYPTMVKVRDTLANILRSAVGNGPDKPLKTNPLEGVRLPKDKRGVIDKPVVTPVEFQKLLDSLPEPAASVVYVALWTGLRISEVAALQWKCIGEQSISIRKRFSRGDWGPTKTKASAATIAAERHVIERIQRLKTLTIEVRAGRAIRQHKLVKTSEPDDLVFQSVWQGKPINAANILRRFVRPAAQKLGLKGVNWLCLRRSCCTWSIAGGADPKATQAQMRHAKIETTMNVYAQFVPENQTRAARQMTEYFENKVNKNNAENLGPNLGPVLVQ